jgi:hypothetical protein
MVAAYALILTLLFNGIHGSLRDLANDYAHGSRTTAIFLGARPAAGQGDPLVPGGFAAYASVVLALLLTTLGLLMFRNDFEYAAATWTVTAGVVGAMALIALASHPLVVRPRGSAWHAAWRLQLYVVTMSLPVAFAAFMPSVITLTLALLHLLALVLFGSTPLVVRWVLRTVHSAVVRSTDERQRIASLSRAE